MGLYDVIDDMAERQMQTGNFGDQRIFGTMIGTVTKNYSKDMPGRVCVEISLRDKNANVLKWARVAMPYVGKKYGVMYMPEIGDQVLLTFEDGNIEKPFVIGVIPTSNSQFVSKYADENNQNKIVVTKNGNSILVYDEKGGDGEKDKIKIETAKGLLHIEINNEKKTISISDKDGKNKFVLASEAGSITCAAEKKFSLKVGDVSVDINGESGKLSVKTGKLKVVGDNSIKIESSGLYKVEAQNISESANSSYKAGSGGSSELKGSIVKVG